MTFDPRSYGGIVTSGATSSELPSRTNSSGASINRTNPVRLDSSGAVQRVDPSIEAQVLSCIGVAKDSVANAAPVGIVTGGRLEDVTVSGLGDQYLSKTGALTNTKPSIGVGGFVAGDFILFVGIAVKNQSNPLLTDLLVNLQVRGQL